MHVLVVGAGAVGQPFGYHLKQGGADLAYLVKPKYREECEAGFTLHQYRMLGGPVRREFDAYDVYVDYEALGEQDWDQVWLCVPTTAVQGEWLPDLLEAVGSTTLVSIQPGIDVREYLESLYPRERIVSGRVSIIAWPTPIGDEDLPEGDIAYFIPPAQPVYFGGEPERAESVADALDSGGCPSEVYEHVLAYEAFTSAVLEPAAAALETADWSLREFRRSSAVDMAARAAFQAVQVVSSKYERRPPLVVRLASRRFIMQIGLPILSVLLPFDLEAYLERHFNKVVDQTRDELVDLIETGDAEGLEVDALQNVLRGLPE